MKLCTADDFQDTEFERNLWLKVNPKIQKYYCLDGNQKLIGNIDNYVKEGQIQFMRIILEVCDHSVQDKIQPDDPACETDNAKINA